MRILVLEAVVHKFTQLEMKLVCIAISILGLILLVSCTPGNTLHELPEGYNTIVYFGYRDIKPAYVKDYTIKDGVITIEDYYYTYYSAYPVDDYFIHATDKIVTSIFTIRPYIKKK